MAHPIDLGSLVSDIEDAAKGVLQKDLTTIAGFSRTQLTAIAKQSAWIAEAIAKDELNKDEKTFFLKNLEDMTRNFIGVLQGLADVAIQHLWDAITGVIWGAIRNVVNAAIPLPSL